VPAAKIGRGHYFHIIYTITKLNYFMLHQLFCIDCGGVAATFAGAGTFGNGLTPLEAYNIDSKIDDGRPDTGAVLASIAENPGGVGSLESIPWGNVANSGGSAVGPNPVCWVFTTGYAYNTSGNQANVFNCGLLFQMK
jgi:hypothetical protein